jgi:pentatricopeptide repeat protein
MCDRCSLCSEPMALTLAMFHAGYSPDAVSYTTLITALSWLGRSADALEAFKELDASPNAQVDLYAYNAVISALSVAGRMTDAKSYLQRAAQLAQDQAAPAPVEAFGAIIKVWYIEAKIALEFYVS